MLYATNLRVQYSAAQHYRRNSVPGRDLAAQVEGLLCHLGALTTAE